MTPTWKRTTLGEDIDLISGQHLDPSAYHDGPTGIPYLTGPSDFTGDKFATSKRALQPKVICEPGDILLTVKGSGTGTLIVADQRYCISRQLMAIRPRTWDRAFVFSVLQLHSENYQNAASGLIPGITREHVLGTILLLPSVTEQKAIAAVLSTWDRGIRQLTDLIAVKLRFKQGLMQQLLTGQRRFKACLEEWRSVQLRDVTTECDERNRGQLGLESVMAVTKADGIIPMKEKTIAADIGRYLIVRKNWFAYNPMRINIGSIARWRGDKEIVVSPDYVVFRCSDANGDGLGMDPDYLDHLRRSGTWEKFVTAAGNGSVRVRIYYADLGHLKFKLPRQKEQRRIANFLNTADREIDLLRKQLAAMKQQKKGLMQKLLTGEIGVGSPSHSTLETQDTRSRTYVNT